MPVILTSDTNQKFAYHHHPKFRLGKGSMGEVYRGWRVENPQNAVAIKRVHPVHARVPQIRERAKFEASLQIDHPNLIKMLGYAELSDGSIYIISELVHGVTLNTFIKTIPVTNRREVVIRIMNCTLDALACLHSYRVWHRDIKPQNIMVENGSNIRIMDLGIATSDGLSFGTIAGKGFGTYPYTPPEQITGKRDEIDGRSDIYSLGITCYELLTDNNPFAGGSDIDIIEKQVKMPLPYHPAVNGSLLNVLKKATEKKKENRYKTAIAFKEALNDAMEGKGNKDLNKIILITASAVIVILIIIALVI